jgi:hypothetical protein
MEIVCSILKGINTVLREINEDSTETSFLTLKDFKQQKVSILSNI